MTRKSMNLEKHDDIFDTEEFIIDVKKGSTVKRLMVKYNVSQYRVVEKKRELD